MSPEGVERVCLLTGRDDQWWWLTRALERMERETDARVRLVVRAGDSEPSATDVDHGFDAPTVTARTRPASDGPGVRLPDDVVDRIARETDVVVHTAVGILSGDILTAPPHGVLSYHHGDLRRYRGVLTHLWNYLNDDDVGGVTLQRLTDDLDAGPVVAETQVDLSGTLTWAEVERRKHIAGVPLVARAIEHLSDPAFEPEQVPESELGRLYSSSDVTLGVIARYLLTETRRTVGTRLRKLRYLLSVHRN